MTTELSHRMSAQDAAFFYFERQTAPLHIGSLGVFEGEIPFDRFVEHIESRLPAIPRYRQRAAFVPLNWAHPTWEDDPDFDIRRHIYRVALPSPGSQQQLIELSARLFAPILNREKPLWEMYVIYGLEGGRTGILSKVHHCLVDGVSGIQLLMAVLDLSAQPAPPPEPAPWIPKPLPDAGARMLGAVWERLEEQRRAAQELAQGMFDPQANLRRAQDTMRAISATTPWMTRSAPRTPFAVTLGPERRAAFSEVSFVEIREIRTTLGGTVNDVVLAILAGALRRYFLAHGHQVDGVDLRVGVPVNVRLEEEQGALGNRVSLMLASLPLGEADPVRRLERIKERVESLKQTNQAADFELLSRLASSAPAPLHAMAGFMTTTNTMLNLICTNVPGPMIPLYSLGHLMLDHYPLVPLSMGMGLGAGVTSYNQRLYFGLMSDPKAVPDIDVLKQFVDESFLELRAAAGVSVTDLPELRFSNGHGAPVEHAGASKKS